MKNWLIAFAFVVVVVAHEKRSKERKKDEHERDPVHLTYKLRVTMKCKHIEQTKREA